MGWEIGDIPEEYIEYPLTLYPVLDASYCYLEWDATRINNKLTITIKVTNESPIVAKDYRLWVGLEDKNGNLLVENMDKSFSLSFQSFMWSTIRLTGPRFDEMRLVVGVMDPEGIIKNLTYSEYFVTR
jgi:hypothetical protein